MTDTDDVRGDDAKIIAIRPGIRITAVQPSARGEPLRVIPGNRDSYDFKMAYHAAAVLRAELDLLCERASMAGFLSDCGIGSEAATRRLWDEYSAALDRLEAALDRLAALPATTRDQARWKKRVIGRIWLRTVDRYRESVERDAARLGRR